MIRHLFLVLFYQLVGEVGSRALGLPIPGPVLGMALLTFTFMLYPPLFTAIRGTISGLLQHLSLLFVPAGVGVVQYLDLMQHQGLQLLAVLILSTGLAIGAGALAFKLMLRFTSEEGNS